MPPETPNSGVNQDIVVSTEREVVDPNKRREAEEEASLRNQERGWLARFFYEDLDSAYVLQEEAFIVYTRDLALYIDQPISNVIKEVTEPGLTSVHVKILPIDIISGKIDGKTIEVHSNGKNSHCNDLLLSKKEALRFYNILLALIKKRDKLLANINETKQKRLPKARFSLKP